MLEDYEKELNPRDAAVQKLFTIYEDVVTEWDRSIVLHGEQDLPMGSGPQWKPFADGARSECDRVTMEGTVSWRHIITEEIWEAMAEKDWSKCRAELTQAAAMIFKAIANGDERNES